MELYFYSQLFAALALLVLAFAALYLSSGRRISRLYFIMNTAWFFSVLFEYTMRSTDQSASLTFARLAMVFWGLGAWAALQFIIEYFWISQGKIVESQKRVWIRVLTLIPMLLIGAVGLNTDLLVKDMIDTSWGYSYELSDSFFIVYTLFVYLSYMLIIMYVLLFEAYYTDNTHKAKASKLILWFSLPLSIAFFFTEIIIPIFRPFPSIGSYYALAVAALLAYVIYKQRLIAVTPLMSIEVVMASMMDGLLILSDNRLIAYANSYFLNLTGLMKDNITERRFSSITNDSREAERMLDRIRDIGSISCYSSDSFEMEIEIVNSHGGLIPFGVSGSYLQKENGYCLVLRDLRRKKQMERALVEKTEALEKFISMASHEIRHPIAVIVGYIDVLPRILEKGDYLERSINGLKDASRQLTGIVNNLLDLSKIESGVLSVEPGRTTIRKIVEESCEQMGFKFPSRQINMIFDLEPEPVVMADSEMIRQVLIIILENALKYSTLDVDVGIERSEGKVNVCVMDKGSGIPEIDHENVFREFYRVEKARSADQAQTGLGLGLYIAASIVRAHGEDIWLENREGYGSCFCFSLKECDS